MALSPGTQLGPYRIEAALGAGGMGEVYRARDTRLDRLVAIKVLPQTVSASPQALERFQREARAASALNHPNICTFHDIGEAADQQRFLVMELLEGETLQQRLTRGALDVPLLVDTSLALADALDAAHRAGIVHRDIKRGNIFLTARGPKILDFGLAKTTVAAAADRADRSEQPTLPGAARLTDPATSSCSRGSGSRHRMLRSFATVFGLRSPVSGLVLPDLSRGSAVAPSGHCWWSDTLPSDMRVRSAGPASEVRSGKTNCHIGANSVGWAGVWAPGRRLFCI